MKIISLCIIFFIIACQSFCQNVFHFTKGLMINSGSRYGREALYTDPMLYRLYTNDLKKPVEGDSFQIGSREQFVKWQAVTADSLNRFRSRGGPESYRGGGGGGGYIYLSYTSDKEQNTLLNIKGNSAVV